MNERYRIYAYLNERRGSLAKGLREEVWGQMARVGSLAPPLTAVGP